MSQPKRIAEYFFMVGLRDDTDLLPIEDHQRGEDIYRDLGGPPSDAARVPMVRSYLYYHDSNSNCDDQYTYNYKYTFTQDNSTIPQYKYNLGSYRVTHD
ncbi:hypothetical protein BGZ68_010457 [Mortierella alpina]|nr:hypothetical protein BGZ68_010457 [Mortierella alpina]